MPATIYKKSDRTYCGNYRRISLLSIAGKIFARILLDRLSTHITPELQFRQSADLFNVAHFRAKTKTTRILMRELLFADDSALVAHSAEEMQKIVDAFSDASKTFGLGSTISSNGCIDDEIQRMMAKANVSFGRLRQ